MIWQALSISRSLAMAKASAAQGQISCSEHKDMIIKEIVGDAGRIDYVEVSSLIINLDGIYISEVEFDDLNQSVAKRLSAHTIQFLMWAVIVCTCRLLTKRLWKEWK